MLRPSKQLTRNRKNCCPRCQQQSPRHHPVRQPWPRNQRKNSFQRFNRLKAKSYRIATQLDALRHGQIERPGQPVLAAPEAPACTPVVDEIEERIAQTILEIAEELSGSNGTGLEDSFPSPDELMQRAIDSASARNDVVHPASDTNDTGDYERLYGELRRKQSEG